MNTNGMSNDDILTLVKKKLEEKNEVIKVQQLQAQEMENRILELEEKLTQYQNAEDERAKLVEGLNEILD